MIITDIELDEVGEYHDWRIRYTKDGDNTYLVIFGGPDAKERAQYYIDNELIPYTYYNNK